MNNSVKDGRGVVIGYRCHVCGEVKDKMWGTSCNECDIKAENHHQLLKALEDTRIHPGMSLAKVTEVIKGVFAREEIDVLIKNLSK